MIIESMTDAAFTAFWPAFRAIIEAEETYAFDPDMTETTARHLWCELPQRTLMARDSESVGGASASGADVLGSYYLKPNAGGPGNHVCNCGYMVAPQARSRGLASRMCEHSQELAQSLGYRAMQFNAVVSTNTGAVRLWQRHGFDIIGTVPGGYRHRTQGYVDSLIMHKTL